MGAWSCRNCPLMTLCEPSRCWPSEWRPHSGQRQTPQHVPGQEESVRAFGARLRGQATTCQYSKQCTCGLVVDYTEENVADALITGLADPDIKQGILGEPNQPLSMERAMSFVESRRQQKRQCHNWTRAALSTRSRASTRRCLDNRSPSPTWGTTNRSAIFVGNPAMGSTHRSRRGVPNARRSATYAARCGKANHSEKVCKSKLTHPQVTENATFDNVCDISTHGAKGHYTLDHHVFDSTTDRWVRRQSLPQPTRRLRARLHPSDYAMLRIPQRPRQAGCSIEGMADTGCQSCLVGTNILHKLGMSKSNLIPVSLKMQAANKSGIHLLGAILLEFTLTGSTNKWCT